jgi:hypothetical protein
MSLESDQMLRRTGITAREAVALAGLNPWASLTAIYDAKVLDKPLQLEPRVDHQVLRA